MNGLGSFSRKNWIVVAKEEGKDAVRAMQTGKTQRPGQDVAAEGNPEEDSA